MYSPGSLRPSVFDLQAGGGVTVRWDLFDAGLFGVSLGATAGYQGLQSYDGFSTSAFQNRAAVAGFLAPNLELRIGGFSAAVEVPVMIPGTFGFNSGYRESPVFPLFVTLGWRFRI
jgi:hypothetical protein